MNLRANKNKNKHKLISFLYIQRLHTLYQYQIGKYNINETIDAFHANFK